MFFPETKETNRMVCDTLDISKHPDMYSEKDIQEYREFIDTNDAILREATKDYMKLNKLQDRHALIQKLHHTRITKKKEQNILWTTLSEETDLDKKRSMMKDYITLNQTLADEYTLMHEECSTVDNFILVEPGTVSRENDTFEGIVKQPTETTKPLGKVLDKNLIPALQGLVMKPTNDMIMNVIVPYRDPGDGSRKAQLKQFKEQMNLIFKEQTDLRIYIIEQESKRDDYGLLPELVKQPNTDMAKFNLGILKNIGFSIASQAMKGKKKKAYYVLSDVDMLPSMKLVDDYLTYPTHPIHLGNTGTRYNQSGNDPHFLGAVVSVNQEEFEQVNGYPNNFWGWGGEDNALNRRLHDNHIPIRKSTEPVIDLENISLQDKLTTLRIGKMKEMRKREKLDEDKTTWSENGLSSLEGSYKVTKKLKMKHITHVKVFLHIDADTVETDKQSNK
jgi:hypothetical protein